MTQKKKKIKLIDLLEQKLVYRRVVHKNATKTRCREYTVDLLSNSFALSFKHYRADLLSENHLMLTEDQFQIACSSHRELKMVSP